MDKLRQTLEPFRIDDQRVAEAYEQAGPKRRSLIKTAIAFSFFHFGKMPGESSVFYQDSSLGISSRCSRTPATCNLLILESGFSAAARVCAGAILPLLAGCNPPLAIIAGEPAAPALCALDMAGTTDIFLMPASRIEEFLAKTCLNPIPAVFLGESGPSAIAANARNKKLSVYEDCLPPTLLKDASICLSDADWQFCQGQIPQTGSPAPGVFYDALYTEKNEAADGSQSRLTLDASGAGFWLFPGLGPDFYRQKHIAIKLSGNSNGFI